MPKRAAQAPPRRSPPCCRLAPPVPRGWSGASGGRGARHGPAGAACEQRRGCGCPPAAGPGLPARRPPPAGCSRSECGRAGDEGGAEEGKGREGMGPGSPSAPGSALRWRERPRGLLGQRRSQPSALLWALSR